MGLLRKIFGRSRSKEAKPGTSRATKNEQPTVIPQRSGFKPLFNSKHSRDSSNLDLPTRGSVSDYRNTYHAPSLSAPFEIEEHESYYGDGSTYADASTRHSTPVFQSHAPPSLPQSQHVYGRRKKVTRASARPSVGSTIVETGSFAQSIPTAPPDTAKEVTPSLLIGIDFGTTFTGAAWAFSKRPNDIKIVTNWDSEGVNNSDQGKAPSRISYTPNLNISSRPNIKGWGYGLEDGETCYVEWFKLLLLDDDDMPEELRNSSQIKRAKDLLQRANRTATEAVTDLLGKLWEHILADIRRALGSGIDGIPFNVVLTVPAVWTTRAVSRMRKAAKDAMISAPRDAGETTINFVSEPEAAAMATFDDLSALPSFKQDDTFVVCDAGGGTVDLISYKVTQVEPLQLKECVEGTGDLCGAVFLDEDFQALMKQLVGNTWNVDDSNIQEIVRDRWEYGIKRQFVGQDRQWRITMPYDAVKTHGAPPEITLNKGHVNDIFDSVVSKVRALVNQQIDLVEAREGTLPKAVVLVGGFGSCRYLYSTLHAEHNPRGIEVYQSSGDKPWTAISRGAVMKALTVSKLREATVTSRITRCSYGVPYCVKFEGGVHEERDKYFGNYEGYHLANNQMQWFLTRGSNISEDQGPIVQPFYEASLVDKNYGPSPSGHELHHKIYSCSDETPPTRIEDSVKSVGKIEGTWNVAAGTIEEGADGKSYNVFLYEIQMTVIGTAIEFSTSFGYGNNVTRKIEVDLDEW